MTEQQEDKSGAHRVLIVDDEASVAKTVRRILGRAAIESEYAENGDAGLRCMETAVRPFSLILCDQRMPGMKGTEFLARAREISPATIRYLITAHSDLDTIINAVNKGAVQYYISKPMDINNMLAAVKNGLRLYEHHLESEQLFALAKQQNAKLYDLNCELVNATQQSQEEQKKLEKKIAGINAQIEKVQAGASAPPSHAMALIREYAAADAWEEQSRFNSLYRATLSSLYEAFSDLALRNGIEMPEPEKQNG